MIVASDLVKVKPLEWQFEARNGWRMGVCFADGYHLVRKDNGWQYANGGGGIYSSVEAAQAAAQADYDRRILAALDLSAVDAMAAKVERLTKALKHTLNYIENTERELGITLGCGDIARAALEDRAP